jgi:hypothetical protein
LNDQTINVFDDDVERIEKNRWIVGNARATGLFAAAVFEFASGSAVFLVDLFDALHEPGGSGAGVVGQGGRGGGLQGTW